MRTLKQSVAACVMALFCAVPAFAEDSAPTLIDLSGLSADKCCAVVEEAKSLPVLRSLS